MIIGILPNPTRHKDWAKIKAYLEPAAKMGGVPVLEKHEEVWTVTEGGELLAAATGRILPDDKAGEIVLCGGRDVRRWVGQLQWLMCAWFRAEGMERVRIYGRKGWARFLHALGWNTISESGKVVAYEKAL